MGAPVEIVQAELVSAQRVMTPETPTPSAGQFPSNLASEGPPGLLTKPTGNQGKASEQTSEPSRASSVPSTAPSQQTSRLDRPSTQETEAATSRDQEASTGDLEVDEEESTITETIWRRLRTIFQRHEGSEDRSSTPPGTRATFESTTLQDPSGTDAEASQQENARLTEEKSKMPKKSADVPSEPGASETVQRQYIGGAEGDEAPSDAERPSQPIMGSESKPSGGKSVAPETIQHQRSPEPSLTAITSGGRSQPQNVQAESTEAEMKIEEVKRDIPLPTKAETAEVPEPVHSEERSAPDDKEGKLREALNESAPEPHRLPEVRTTLDDATSAVGRRSERPPLQEVWNVQTRERRQALKSSSPTGSNQTSPTEADVTPQVRQVMRQVTSDRPTRSSIEVIQPRHPRPKTPTNAQLRSSREDQQQPLLENAEPGYEVSQDAVSRRTIQPKHAKPEGTEAQPMHLDVEATREDGETGTRETQTPPTSSGKDQPVMIDTEIGSLPRDLWELIGEPIPVAKEPADSRPTQRERSTETREHNVNGRRPSQVTRERESVEPHIQSNSPTDPLRATEKAGGIAQRAESPTVETPETQPETSRASEDSVDIDELTRRVYDEVRRRLAVELERIRSYF
jgi:hypothetical protein